MSIRSALGGVALALAAGCPSASSAQVPAAPEVVVEVLGLDEWTVEMVEDSLSRYAPGVTLEDAACAVILRDSIGFAQAAVHQMTYQDTTWLTLSVVEPRDSARVRVRTYADTLPLRESWSDAIAIMVENRRAIHALQNHDFLSGRTDSFYGQPVDSGGIALRDEVRRLAETHGDSIALWTLEYDGNRDNRSIASFILGHFPERQSTWHALMRSVRGPSNFETSMSGMVLAGLARAAPRPVDWQPLREDLDHLVAGANLFAWVDVLKVLTATDLDPALGRYLVADAPGLLLDNLASANRSRRGVVRRFLTHVAGTDKGEDSAAWAAWVASLAPEAEPESAGDGDA